MGEHLVFLASLLLLVALLLEGLKWSIWIAFKAARLVGLALSLVF